jgi:hypothetical protein
VVGGARPRVLLAGVGGPHGPRRRASCRRRQAAHAGQRAPQVARASWGGKRLGGDQIGRGSVRRDSSSESGGGGGGGLGAKRQGPY